MRHEPFRDNVVVITGASSGIGRALALDLAGRGARLVLAARREDRLREVAAACRARGALAAAVPTDVAEESQCRALVMAAVDRFGRIDTLINNAGSTLVADLAELPNLRTFERVIRVNFLGGVYCTYHALPHLLQSDGRIVAVSSVKGRIGTPKSTAYCASKHAMAGFFDALRNELHRTGVSVTVIYPGLVATPVVASALDADGEPLDARARDFFPRGTMTAARCAHLIVRAAARRRRERTLTARGHVAPWAKLIAPGLVDRIARRTIRRWESRLLAPDDRSGDQV